MSTTTNNICPTCGGFVGIQANGTLFPHKRYADGTGYGPGQSHELVPCEGGSELAGDRHPGGRP